METGTDSWKSTRSTEKHCHGTDSLTPGMVLTIPKVANASVEGKSGAVIRAGYGVNTLPRR